MLPGGYELHICIFLCAGNLNKNNFRHSMLVLYGQPQGEAKHFKKLLCICEIAIGINCYISDQLVRITHSFIIQLIA